MNLAIEPSEFLSACPVCESPDITPIADHRHVRYSQCRRCKVEFQNPMPTNEALRYHYSSGEYRRRRGHELKHIVPSQQKRAQDIVDFMFPRVPRVDRFLEFGSGTGELLALVQQTLEADVFGVEIDPVHAEYANDHGRTTGVALPTRSKFDLMATSHTLEHLRYPGLVLRKMAALAAEDCLLYVEVPATKGTIEHVIVFSTESLRRALELNGWTVLEQENINRGAKRGIHLRAWAKRKDATPNV